MNSFKIGDIIECVEDGLVGLTLGKRYEVLYIANNNFVEVVDDFNGAGNYYPERFKLVTKAEDTLSPEQHIKNFLKKLEYVLINDYTVEGRLDAVNMLYMESTVSTIYGVEDIYTYVNASYDQITSQVAQKRKLELEAKRLKVLDELSAIDQELGGYDAN